jgi:hypothetical protein
MTHDQVEMTEVGITPIMWCRANRLWRRIDNIDHAKYQLGRPSSNKTFWRSVLELLGSA